jgi:hypothetical protein
VSCIGDIGRRVVSGRGKRVEVRSVRAFLHRDAEAYVSQILILVQFVSDMGTSLGNSIFEIMTCI